MASIAVYVRKCRREMSEAFDIEIKSCTDCPDHDECIIRLSDAGEVSYYIEGGM